MMKRFDLCETGKRFRMLRVSRKLTQEEMGEILHVSRQSICMYEAGKSAMALDTIVEISEFFAITTDWLLKGK